VIVYTESKSSNEDSDEIESPVKLKLIGEKGSSEIFSLDNMNESNFVSGKSEKFTIVTDNNIGVPTHLVLNFKDKETFDWIVNKVRTIRTR
jgi:hypothetical protein